MFRCCELLLLQLREQQREGTIEDLSWITTPHTVSKQILRSAQLLVGVLSDGELQLVSPRHYFVTLSVAVH